MKISLKDKRLKNYNDKALERDSILFKWNSEGVKLPYNPEFWVITNGSLGFLIKEQKWVVGSFDGRMDEYGDFKKYIWHSLNTDNVETGEAENHKDIIVCGNTSLYRPFNEEREFYSTVKAEADVSIMCQLLLSRLNKAIVAENDQIKKQLEESYENIIKGYPVIFTSSLLEEINTIDLTDNSDIEKMQYISSFFQNIEKREANDYGIDLELIDKRAQVSNSEIKQYDDITTLEFLIMYEQRQKFVQEMKDNGFNIDIVKNPVFFDEPNEKDVEDGTFTEAETEEEKTPKNMEENQEEKDNEKDN